MQENAPQYLADRGGQAATLQPNDLIGDIPGSRTGSPASCISLDQRHGSKKRAQKNSAGRIASEDQQNRPTARKSSQYKGVSWSERSSKWRAQMWYGNKVHPILSACMIIPYLALAFLSICQQQHRSRNVSFTPLQSAFVTSHCQRPDPG